MPQDKKKSIKEFADEIRQNVDDPSLKDMADEDIVRQVLEAAPEAINDIQTSERRPFMKPEGNAALRFAKGMGSVIPETAEGLARLSGGLSNPATSVPTVKAIGRGLKETVKNPGNLLDMPNIRKDRERNDDAHAAGRSVTQGILTASALQGLLTKAGVLTKTAPATGAALKEMEAIGTETSKDAAMAIAKRVSRPQATTLDKTIADISKAMDNQYISSKSLSAGIAYAKKVIEKVSKAPGAQVKDVSAAKEAVARLSAKIKANPNIIPWNDAREALKELEQSAKTLGPSAAKNSVLEVASALKKEVQSSAHAAGQGAAYDKWVSDYAAMSKWQRGYARVLNRQTQLQKETQLAAKDGASVGIPKTNLKVRFGKARADKIAEANKSMIEKAHKGLEELDAKIKTQPPQATPPAPAAGGAPPASPTPAPPAAPPQGGGNPSMAAGQAAFKQGQTQGMAQRGPMPVMQPPIAPGQLGPMQQRIIEQLKKMQSAQAPIPPQS